MLDLAGPMLGLERPMLGLELQMWGPASSPIRLVLSGYANHRRWWCLFKKRPEGDDDDVVQTFGSMLDRLGRLLPSREVSKAAD